MGSLKKRVYVGAGHSTSDPGSSSADGKLVEAVLAVELRDLIADALARREIPFLTDGPGNDPLRTSIELANECEGPRLELHFNVAASPKVSGVECFSLPKNKVVARSIALAVARYTDSPLRGDFGWRPPSESARGKLGFCSEANGLVLEVEFITNPKAMETYQRQRALVAGSIATVLAAWSEGRI